MRKKTSTQTSKQMSFPFNAPGGLFQMTIEKTGKDKFVIKKIVPIITTMHAMNGTIPEAGHYKYFVACHKLGIYTSIGADNIHHASNKATKLFGPHWSFIRDEYHSSDIGAMVHCNVAKFGELIKTLAN